MLLLILAIAMASSAYILAKTSANSNTCTGDKCNEQPPIQQQPAPGGGPDRYDEPYHHYLVSSFR